MINQEGFIKLTRMNVGKLTDADFNQARKEGALKQLLASLDVDDVHEQRNLIHGSQAAWVFCQLFSSANVIADSIWQPAAGLLCVVLSTKDSEPYVTFTNGNNYYYDSVPTFINNIGYGYISYKRFEEDQAETDEIISDPNGREAVWYRERWLWNPSEAVSSAIRSFLLINGSQNNANDGYYQMIGHIRLKDSNGLPIIYTKTASQILLAEYKFIVVSV